jgi:hypothetical protein
VIDQLIGELKAVKRWLERRFDVIWGVRRTDPNRPMLMLADAKRGDALLVVWLPERPDSSYAGSVTWRGRWVFYWKRRVGQ